MAESQLSPEISFSPTRLEQSVERWKVITGQELTLEGIKRLGGPEQVDLVRSGWEKQVNEKQQGFMKTQEEVSALGGGAGVDKLVKLWNFHNEFGKEIYDAVDPEKRGGLVCELIEGRDFDSLSDQEKADIVGLDQKLEELEEKYQITEDDRKILNGVVEEKGQVIGQEADLVSTVAEEGHSEPDEQLEALKRVKVEMERQKQEEKEAKRGARAEKRKQNKGEKEIGEKLETEEEEYQRLSARLREGGQSGLTAGEMDRFYELDIEYNKVHYQKLNKQVNNKINLGGEEGLTGADGIWKELEVVDDGGAGMGSKKKSLEKESEVIEAENGGKEEREENQRKAPGAPETEGNKLKREQGEVLKRVKAEMDRRKREESFAGRFANFMGKMKEGVTRGAEAGRVAIAGLVSIGERVKVKIEESRAGGKEKRRAKIEREIDILKAQFDVLRQTEGRAEREPYWRKVGQIGERTRRLEEQLARIDGERREKRQSENEKIVLARRLQAVSVV